MSTSVDSRFLGSTQYGIWKTAKMVVTGSVLSSYKDSAVRLARRGVHLLSKTQGTFPPSELTIASICYDAHHQIIHFYDLTAAAVSTSPNTKE